MLDPVEHEADKGVFVDVGNERFVFRADRHTDGLLFDHALKQIVGQLIEISFNLFTADGMIDVHNEGFVGQDCLEDLLKALLPCFIGLLSCQRLRRVLLTRPFDQIVDVFEMVIERHAIDTAVIGDIADGDFMERLLQEQIFKRLLQRAFGQIGHMGLLSRKAYKRFFSEYPLFAEMSRQRLDRQVYYVYNTVRECMT